MSEDTVAYQHLLSTMLKIHKENSENMESLQEIDYVNFSEEEIKTLVEALWANRFSDSRSDFQDLVGQLVSKLVSKN